MQAEGFSGADLAALVREAGLDVLRQLKTRELIVGKGAYTEKGESSRRHDSLVKCKSLPQICSYRTFFRDLVVGLIDSLCESGDGGQCGCDLLFAVVRFPPKVLYVSEGSLLWCSSAILSQFEANRAMF